MASSFSKNYTVKTNMHALINMLSDPAFLNSQDLHPITSHPEGKSYRFLLSHGESFSSFSETIVLLLTPQGPTTTQAYIHAECAMSTQIFDWGKTKKLVEGLYKQIYVYMSHYRIQGTPGAAAQSGFCRHCGASLAANAIVCTACGNRI